MPVPTLELALRVSDHPSNEGAPVLARAAAGDRDAQDALYRQHARWLWRVVIVPILRDPARAEDVLCEAFLSAFRALPTWRAPPERDATEAFAHWLAQIARRKAIDELRRDARGARLLERAARSDPDGDAMFPGAMLPGAMLPGAMVPGAMFAENRSGRDAPAEAAALALEQAHERRARIEAILVELHDRYAEAIRLRLLEGCSREACAARMQVRVPTFDVTLHRALRAFRTAYEERYGAGWED